MLLQRQTSVSMINIIIIFFLHFTVLAFFSLHCYFELVLLAIVMLSCTVSLQKSPDSYRWSQCHRSSPHRHWQVWPHHTSSLRRSALAASTSEDWVQDRCSRVRLCPWYWPCLYFKDVCVPVSNIAARSSFRSAQRGDLFVPRTRTTKLSRRSFTVALRSSGIHYRLTYDHHW